MERKKTQLEIFQSVGYLAKVQVSMPKRVKIGPKTMDCVFIGYAKSSKACRLLVHKFKHPDINENTTIESDNAELFENIYLYKTRHEQSSGGSKRPRDDPSYVSPKSDVYVFSMLLVELITKKEFDYSFFYTKECRKENLVDESFKEVDLQTGSRITNLTYRCTNTEPEERPTMKDVLDVLKEATKMGAKGRKRERDENEDGSQGGETKKR
ncbi:hypothetical protein BC332_33998 [Capsicum chinense]|nr:hypothetical protein BC332_33998 [Capsicum chinense]